MPYAYSVYSSESRKRVVIVKNGKKKILRIQTNLFKVMRLFLDVMGPVVRTFVVPDIREMEDTVEYLCHLINNPRQLEHVYEHKLNFKVQLNFKRFHVSLLPFI